MNKLLIVTTKLNSILITKNLTAYQLSKLMQVSDSALYHMMNGKTSFSNKFIEKILPFIEVSREEFESWIVADKYSKETIELAINAKEKHTGDKLILTTKIDEILQSKNLSRTALSKLIDYYQGKLNRMIIGKEPMSKLVISKIAPALEVSEDTIKSWILADKYSIQILKLALNEQ